MNSTIFYYSHLRFLSGPIFIQDTGSRWTVGIMENVSSLDPRRSKLSYAPLHASMRAFETPERLLTLDGGERYKKSYPVPDDLLINRRGLAWYRVSRNSICLTHVWENARIARTHVIMLERVRLSIHMIYVYANISYQDAPAPIVRRSNAVNVRIVSNCRISDSKSMLRHVHVFRFILIIKTIQKLY